MLRLMVNKSYLEEIEGDMEELFYDNADRWSPSKARRMYTWELFKLMRPVLMRNMLFLGHNNQLTMLGNYFKVSIRAMMKTPLNSFINIIGLSISIAVCVFGYAFARWTFSTDQFHKNKNEVFLVTHAAERDGAVQWFGTTPRPLGEALRQDYLQVTNMCRVEDRSVVVKNNADVFHERIRFTDPGFLEMFTFPLKWGNVSALKDVNTIILSEPMSKKYFGDENPVGQNLRVIFAENDGKDFKVGGVAKEFPKSITIQFNFLVNIENLRVGNRAFDVHDWSTNLSATFIQVQHPRDLNELRGGMEKYRQMQNQAVKEDFAITQFGFEPLATLHERSEDIRDDISRSSRDNYLSIIFIVVIGLALLGIACFNYINIAIVTATRRLKEIGIRKCIGATRKTVTIQFLSENIVLTLFALIVGLLIAYTVLIPGFEKLWNFNMDFSWLDPALWIYLPLLLLFTSIVSGIYPSLYISRFQVVSILKGAMFFGKRNPLTKIFLGFQFILAAVFTTTSIMFTQNTAYMSERGWGYNQENALYARVPDGAGFEKLSTLMATDPDVVSIAGSRDHVGRSNARAILHAGSRDLEVDELAVDPEYFSTLEIPLLQGRSFNQQENSDRHGVVVNQLLVATMGWSEPVGQEFRIDSTRFEVIGVVKDFHSYSFSKQVRPIIFTRAEKAQYRYLTVKATTGKELAVYERLQDRWASLYPEVPFEGNLQEDVWGFYYQEIRIYALVWKIFASMAITMCILGLYGMVKLNIEGRTKEFSIRKVLGAGVRHITVTVTRQYTALLIVGLAVGTPLGFWFANFLITTDPYHMPVTTSSAWWTVVIITVLLLGTIATQIGKVVKANPVDGLKVD